MTKAKERYNLPQNCDMCGSPELEAEFIVMDNDGLMAVYWCKQCGYHKGISKAKNEARRNNSSLSNWSKRIIKRDLACVICGSRSDLEAHHIIPVSNSKRYEYKDSNGIALCKNCHLLVHNKEEEVQDMRIAKKVVYGNFEGFKCSSCGWPYTMEQSRFIDKCTRCGCVFKGGYHE